MTHPVRFAHFPSESWELFLEDRLPAASAARLEEHLDECAECLAALEQADPSRIFRRLRGLEVRDAAWDGFWDGIREQIETPAAPPELEVAEVATPRTHEARGVGRRSLGLAAAAVAVLAAIVALRVGPGESAIEPALAACVSTDVVADLQLTPEELSALCAPIEAVDEPVLVYDPSLELRSLL